MDENLNDDAGHGSQNGSVCGPAGADEQRRESERQREPLPPGAIQLSVEVHTRVGRRITRRSYRNSIDSAARAMHLLWSRGTLASTLIVTDISTGTLAGFETIVVLPDHTFAQLPVFARDSPWPSLSSFEVFVTSIISEDERQPWGQNRNRVNQWMAQVSDLWGCTVHDMLPTFSPPPPPRFLDTF